MILTEWMPVGQQILAHESITPFLHLAKEGLDVNHSFGDHKIVVNHICVICVMCVIQDHVLPDITTCYPLDPASPLVHPPTCFPFHCITTSVLEVDSYSNHQRIDLTVTVCVGAAGRHRPG